MSKAQRLFAAIKKVDAAGNRRIEVGTRVEWNGKKGVVIKKILGSVNLVSWEDLSETTHPNYDLKIRA